MPQDTENTEENLREVLISEAIIPDTDSFNTDFMALAQPGVPMRFTWRGKLYEVASVVRTWKNLRNCRAGSGEKYVHKHFYEVKTGGGEIMTLYCTRQPGKKQEWTLYTRRNAETVSDTSGAGGALRERSAQAAAPLRAGVLVSGGGTNLQALIDAHSGRGKGIYSVELVISDKEGVFALERARKADINTELALSPEGLERSGRRTAVSQRILELAGQYRLDVLVLAGFLTILTGPVVDAYSGRIINLHPALLPKFGGPGMYGRRVHEAVLKAGEKESGCTVHLVDSGCDTGPILLQRTVPVMPADTADTLAERIHAEEHIAIVDGILALAQRIRDSKNE